MRLPVIALGALTLLGTAASASERPQASVPTRDGFVKRYGPGWVIVTDETTGAPSFAYGKQFTPPYAPKSLDDFDLAARSVIDENADFLGLDSTSLETVQVKYLNLSRIGTSDKIAACFAQKVGGVTVFNGSVAVLFDAAHGTVVALDNNAVPFAQNVSLHPASTPNQAVEAAERAYAETMGVNATSVDRIEMLVV